MTVKVKHPPREKRVKLPPSGNPQPYTKHQIDKISGGYRVRTNDGEFTVASLAEATK